MNFDVGLVNEPDMRLYYSNDFDQKLSQHISCIVEGFIDQWASWISFFFSNPSHPFSLCHIDLMYLGGSLYLLELLGC